jgi:hypothetical protein
MGLTTGLTIGSYVHCIIYAAMVVATNWELQVRLYPPARKQREAQPPQREVFRSAGVLTRPAGCSETRHDRVLGHHQLPQLKLHSQYREGANTPSWVLPRPCSGTPPAAATQAPLTVPGGCQHAQLGAPRLGTTVFWDTTSCRNSSSTHTHAAALTRHWFVTFSQIAQCLTGTQAVRASERMERSRSASDIKAPRGSAELTERCVPTL